MAIIKDQVLKKGIFYSDQNVIYLCRITNLFGFLKDISLFSLLIGAFSFFIIEWFALLLVPLTWPILIWFLLPKYYRYIQLNKFVIVIGKGSIISLIKSGFKTPYNLEKYQYSNIHHIRFDKWEQKKRGGIKDSFGRIEVKINDLRSPFHILINSLDLTHLIKIFETHRFQIKVNKSRTRGELLLTFPSSPLYNTSI